MLPIGLHLYECVTWKKILWGDGWRYFANSYPLGTYGEPSRGIMDWQMRALITAEQFLYSPDVKMIGAIIWRISNGPGQVDQNFVRVHDVVSEGNHVRDTPTEFIDWEHALIYKKESLSGRSGRVAFRAAAMLADVVPYRNGRYALRDGKPFGIFKSELIEFWFNEITMDHYILSRPNELSQPTDARKVERVKLGGMSVFQSIADAQERKTPLATPYFVKWQNLLVVCFEYVRTVEILRYVHVEGMPRPELQSVRALLDDLKIRLLELLEYWQEGIKPYPMLNWRPTAGLDPLSLQCMDLVTTALQAVKESADIVSDLEEFPGEYIPDHMTLALTVKMSWACALIERIGTMRFTGTPLPMPAI